MAGLFRAQMMLLLALSAGCGESGPDAARAEYLVRLGRTLSVDVAEPRPPSLVPTPRPGQLRLDLASPGIDTLDFLQLGGCALQVNIGRRNSSLGRLAKDSQRLLLDLEYLRLAPDCVSLQRERGNRELADSLEQARQQKQRQLPARIFNATLGGEEYLEFWRSATPSTHYPADTSTRVIAALDAINTRVERWLAADYRADNREFEILLSEVRKGDGGALLSTLGRQAASLAAADRMLAARGPLCASGLQPEAANILRNVIRRFFIDGIQPHAAALNTRRHQLLPPVSALEELLSGALPDGYRQWRAQRSALLNDYSEAPRRHVAQLQQALTGCNV